MDDVLQIIQSIDTNKINLNPTEIYNEGWMIRLLIKKSIEEKKVFNNIDFTQLDNWTSEGLISSPFIKAPINREGYTRADIAIGSFKIDYEKRGEIIVDKGANIFGIMEAKMKSNLSQGTKYANDYNQASRNIACILSNTEESTKCFFCVVAPLKYIRKHDFQRQINLNTVYLQIKNRFDCYEDSFKLEHKCQDILTRVMNFNSFTISFESWIEIFEGETYDILLNFYEKSIRWNRIKC